MKDFNLVRFGAVGGLGAVASKAYAAPVDLTSLTTAVDFSTTTTAIRGIASPLLNNPSMQGSQQGNMQGSQNAFVGSALSFIDTAFADQVVLNVEPRYCDKIHKLLDELGTPVQVVRISAAVYEFNASKDDGSGLSLTASLLGGKVTASIGGLMTGAGYGYSGCKSTFFGYAEA